VKNRIKVPEDTMEWEKPEFVEVSLACEISGYANAELDAAANQEKPEGRAFRG
jgi:coenzyme PQQ precursor peptide PqqA